MDLLWCQLFTKTYGNVIYDVSADFLVPALVLFVTITGAVRLSKKEFKRSQKLEEEKENKTNRQILDIVRNSLDSTLEEIPRILDYLKVFENIDFNIVETTPRTTLDPSFLDSLLRIDLVTLVNAIESDSRHSDFDVVNFAANLNGLKSIYSIYDREDQKFHQKLTDFNSRFYGDYINVLSEITLFHSANYMEASQKINYLSMKLREKLNDLNQSKALQRKEEISRVYIIKTFIKKVVEILGGINDPDVMATKLFQLCKEITVRLESIEHDFKFFGGFCKQQGENLDSTYKNLVQYRKLLD